MTHLLGSQPAAHHSFGGLLPALSNTLKEPTSSHQDPGWDKEQLVPTASTCSHHLHLQRPPLGNITPGDLPHTVGTMAGRTVVPALRGLGRAGSAGSHSRQEGELLHTGALSWLLEASICRVLGSQGHGPRSWHSLGAHPVFPGGAGQRPLLTPLPGARGAPRMNVTGQLLFTKRERHEVEQNRHPLSVYCVHHRVLTVQQHKGSKTITH